MGVVRSFGARYGKPKGVEIFFAWDLPNPYSHGMRKLTGRDRKVRDWLLGFEETWELIDRIVMEVRSKGLQEVAIGCLGGKHRSVVVAEEVGKILGWKVVHDERWRFS